MIVRISGEDQYRLPDSDSGEIGELEGAVVTAVEGGDEQGFDVAFRSLFDFVRSHGTPIGEDELESSDVILPPSDLSFVEAGSLEFTGEGLIPD